MFCGFFSTTGTFELPCSAPLPNILLLFILFFFSLIYTTLHAPVPFVCSTPVHFACSFMLPFTPTSPGYCMSCVLNDYTLFLCLPLLATLKAVSFTHYAVHPLPLSTSSVYFMSCVFYDYIRCSSSVSFSWLLSEPCPLLLYAVLPLSTSPGYCMSSVLYAYTLFFLSTSPVYFMSCFLYAYTLCTFFLCLPLLPTL